MLLASAYGHLPVVQYLVEEKGADIKEKNIDGKFYYLVVSFIV